MIHCLLVNISHSPRGHVIRQERQLSDNTLSIGRGAECKIHLPDHRVSLHQANISHGDDGRLYIASEDGHLLEIDGHLVENVPLLQGMRIAIGPYALTVEAITGFDEITLGLEHIHQEVHVAPPIVPNTLAATGLSKRKPALWLAGIITLIFLVLPIVYTLHPGLHKTALKYHLPLDEPLNAGNMSSSHRALSIKCKTCHQKPFTAVSNQACENCHQSIAHHISDPILNKKIFKNVRCTSCHLDHRGKIGLIRHDAQQCVSCHGNIKKRHDKTKLFDVHDFSTDHPAFQLTFSAGQDSENKRIRQTDKSQLIEHSGLKFSHEIHFDKALIQLPGDKNRDIQCADCHLPSEAGTGFKQMNMPLTCQQSNCHSIQLTPPIEGRQIPHASEKTVMTTLRELFASRAINNTYKNGSTIDDLKRARLWAEAEANRNATALFTKVGEGTCLECHEITHDPENKETPWKVAPVRITEHWLPKSHFPHDKHSTEKCTSCHNVMKSKKSSDVAIPAIKKCRECHVGSKQALSRVSSTCDTCHNFHEVRMQESHK